MRHPLARDGVTVALDDVVGLLCDLLESVGFKNWQKAPTLPVLGS